MIAGRVVGLDAAIQQMQRLADDAAVEHVLDREALLVIGLRVVRGVVAVGHLDRGDLLGLGAVIVHVAHEGRREALPGALPAIGAVVQHVAADRRGGARAGAADAHLRIAVHRPEDRHDLAAAGLDQADRDADQRLGRRAAAEHVHVEIEAHAEIAGDEGPRGRVAALIGQHAVDVARASARRRASRSGPPRSRAPASSCPSRGCRSSRRPRRSHICRAGIWGWWHPPLRQRHLSSPSFHYFAGLGAFTLTRLAPLAPSPAVRERGYNFLTSKPSPQRGRGRTQREALGG